MIRSAMSVILFLLCIIYQTASAQYCTPVFQVGCTGNTAATTGTLYADINTFALTGADGTSINDSSTGCSSPFSYTDHTNDTVTLYQWATYSGTINSDGSPGGNMQVYVDFNDDGIFQALENIGGINGIATQPLLSTFNILIPPSASAGNHRMRVIVTDSADAVYPNIDPCAGVAPANYIYGEVHDYTANIVLPACTPPDPVIIGSITDTSASVSFFSVPGPGWQYVLDTTDVTSYTPSLPPISFDAAPIYLNALTQGTTYYLFVRDTCSSGGYSSWVKKTFTTTTCQAIIPWVFATTDSTAQINWAISISSAYGIGYEYVIDTVATTPTGPLVDSTGGTVINVAGLQPATLYYAHVRDSCGPGELSVWTTVPFSTLCPAPASLFAVNISDSSFSASWVAGNAVVGSGYEYVIDTNAADPLVSGTGTTDTFANVTGLLPATTYYAHLRDSCGRSGNFSDWLTISFNTYPECRPPLSISANAISDSGAAISWIPDPTSVGPGYEYVINTSATLPAISATITTDTFVNVTGLLSSTIYYVHIRDSCGPTGNFSAWTTYSFSTSPLCLPPVSTAATGITYNSATINWAPDSASVSIQYQYIIDTNPATPAASGTATTDTFVNITGLLPYTTYYAHVRDSCGATDLSAWVTSSFTTLQLPCPGPILAASGISDSSATITWLSFSGGAVSNGCQYIVNTSATDTAGTTITTTDTFIHPTGLLPGTTYYVHVRDSCVPTGNFSFWCTIPFTTLTLCTLPALLTANSITDSSAIINWYLDSTSLGLGYQYVIDTSAGYPTISGTATTDSFVNVVGLNPATTYYVHVRDSCGPGYLSAWVTISFTTLPLPCPLPLIAADSISDSSAVITWTTDSTGATSTGYQYTVNTSAASPSGSGTATADTVANATGLLPGTVYYAHVRDSCGPGDFSAWVTTSFTTLPLCLPPTAVSASGISYTTATINWTGSSGYSEFQVNAAAADTTGISSVTTTTSASIAGLLPGTTYYFHVRDSCGPGDYSAWITISFTTADESVANTNNPLFSVTTYPNPAKSIVNVRIAGKQTQKAGAVITDINGKIITTVDVTGDTFSIDLSTYPVGIYVLRYTDSLHTQTVKITKE